MKKYIGIFLALLFIPTALSLAQNEEPEMTETANGPYLARSLNWMDGNWEGQGERNEIAFSSALEVDPILDATGLLLKRSSAGGYEEAMLLGYDTNSKKNVATLYDNRYHTGLYTCDLGTNELSCVQVVSVQGYASKRIYQLMPDGNLQFSIQRKDPQNQEQKVLEIIFKKKL